MQRHFRYCRLLKCTALPKFFPSSCPPSTLRRRWWLILCCTQLSRAVKRKCTNNFASDCRVRKMHDEKYGWTNNFAVLLQSAAILLVHLAFLKNPRAKTLWAMRKCEGGPDSGLGGRIIGSRDPTAKKFFLACLHGDTTREWPMMVSLKIRWGNMDPELNFSPP